MKNYNADIILHFFCSNLSFDTALIIAESGLGALPK